jgi:hypothetical protein
VAECAFRGHRQHGHGRVRGPASKHDTTQHSTTEISATFCALSCCGRMPACTGPGMSKAAVVGITSSTAQAGPKTKPLVAHGGGGNMGFYD